MPSVTPGRPWEAVSVRRFSQDWADTGESHGNAAADWSPLRNSIMSSRIRRCSLPQWRTASALVPVKTVSWEGWMGEDHHDLFPARSRNIVHYGWSSAFQIDQVEQKKIARGQVEGYQSCGNGESSNLANPRSEFHPPSPVQATAARMISIWR